jgi:hemerythrin HHE cation binding domain-containing protein
MAARAPKASPRPGVVHAFLARDHERLNRWLERAAADPARIDRAAYRRFRAGLLRHIKMEEKVLLPYARWRSGAPLPVARRLRADHAALAALLVPPPTHALLATIRDVLEAHNPIEEGPGGLYASCEALAESGAGRLLAHLRAVRQVKLAPHNDHPHVHEHIEHLLRARHAPPERDA